MSADVIASLANDAAKLPPGSAVIVDDFHAVSATVADDMCDLVERWPAETTQLILASRSDPPVRLHRLRLAGELCEVGDDELRFSRGECRDLLVSFGLDLRDEQLALLHQRTEGWAAALQMAAQSLRGSGGSAQVARALAALSHAISEYFVSEVLDLQSPDVAQFMLDISILGQLTADSCAALTGRPDAARLLRSLGTAHVFLVALDDARTRFRYHHLVRQVLRAELRTRDPLREQELQVRVAEWFEAVNHTQNAIQRYLAARRADRALALIEKRVVPGFLSDPVLPAPLDLSTINPAMLVEAPDQLLAVAAHLLLSGNTSGGGRYLDMLERAGPTMDSRLRGRFMAVQSLRHALIGDADRAVRASLSARSVQERTQQVDEWNVAVPMILLSAYTWLEDFAAVELEAATALAVPHVSEPVKLVAVPGARALALFESGRLNLASDWARRAETKAQRLGFNGTSSPCPTCSP
jgi:LuxR family transcriptional regulator, maltose regulon positive regulatory protein